MRKAAGYLLMSLSVVVIVGMGFRAFYNWLVEGTQADLLLDGVALALAVVAYALGLAIVTALPRD